MDGVRVADLINRLPFKHWLDCEELARDLESTPAQVEKILRAGRRRGSITVHRKGDRALYMRIARHPLPCAKLRAAS